MSEAVDFELADHEGKGWSLCDHLAEVRCYLSSIAGIGDPTATGSWPRTHGRGTDSTMRV